MAKKMTSFVCQSCAHISLQWIGKCPECSQWNSFEEESVNAKSSKREMHEESEKDRPLRLAEIGNAKTQKIITGIQEFDRVMGQGLTTGSLILIGGEPGIGKSTLLSMVLGKLCMDDPHLKLLYVSGEESKEQVSERMKRIGVVSEYVYIYHETSWQSIKNQLQEIKPKFLVVDSIQTTSSSDLDSPPGTVSQIREVTYELMNYVKAKGITCFIVGHITKEGNIAGPKILEHMVDTVIYFEGDQFGHYRMIRAIKNRFGNTNEVGIFEMSEEGLREVKNPGQYFLDEHLKGSFGNSLTCIMEGSRTILVEIQALVIENKNGNGRRTTQGLEANRLSMLVAIIEKYFSISLSFSDIYINVVGGMKLSTRESDLGILAAFLSSIHQKPLSSEMIFLGEVGLTGEVRSVVHVEKRIREIEQLGYKYLVTSKKTAEKYSGKSVIKIIGINHAKELVSQLSSS